MIYINPHPKAMERMAKNGLPYHNEDHVRKVLQHLAKERVELHPYLKTAADFHDVIYDRHPKKEYRSVIFMQNHMLNDGYIENYDDMDKFASMAAECIMATVDHDCSKHKEHTWPLIRADLSDLAKPAQTIRNFGLIMEESMGLYGINEKEFATKNIEFMENLRKTVINNVKIDKEHKDFWNDVYWGCLTTLELSRKIL